MRAAIALETEQAVLAVHVLRNALQLLEKHVPGSPFFVASDVTPLIVKAIDAIEQLEQLRQLTEHHLRVSRDENVALGREAKLVEDAKASMVELCTSMRDISASRLAASGLEYRALNTIYARLTGPIRPMGVIGAEAQRAITLQETGS